MGLPKPSSSNSWPIGIIPRVKSLRKRKKIFQSHLIDVQFRGLRQEREPWWTTERRRWVDRLPWESHLPMAKSLSFYHVSASWFEPQHIFAYSLILTTDHLTWFQSKPHTRVELVSKEGYGHWRGAWFMFVWLMINLFGFEGFAKGLTFEINGPSYPTHHLDVTLNQVFGILNPIRIRLIKRFGLRYVTVNGKPNHILALHLFSICVGKHTHLLALRWGNNNFRWACQIILWNLSQRWGKHSSWSESWTQVLFSRGVPLNVLASLVRKAIDGVIEDFASTDPVDLVDAIIDQTSLIGRRRGTLNKIHGLHHDPRVGRSQESDLVRSGDSTLDREDPFSLTPAMAEEQVVCLLSAGFLPSNRFVVRCMRSLKTSKFNSFVSGEIDRQKKWSVSDHRNAAQSLVPRSQFQTVHTSTWCQTRQWWFFFSEKNKIKYWHYLNDSMLSWTHTHTQDRYAERKRRISSIFYF